MINYRNIIVSMVLISALLITGCQRSENKNNSELIKGEWISLNYTEKPALLKINGYSLTFPQIYNILSPRYYKIKNDSLILTQVNFGDIYIHNYSIYNDTLSFFNTHNFINPSRDSRKDTIVRKYVRNTYPNIFEYVKQRNGININLPTLKGDRFLMNSFGSVIYVEKKNYYLGLKRIDTLTTLDSKLEPPFSFYGYYGHTCFIDKNITYKELLNLKLELVEANNDSIQYVTVTKNNKLNHLIVPLPYFENLSIDQSKKTDNKHAIISKAHTHNDFNNFNICKIENGKILFNDKECSIDSIEIILKNSFVKNRLNSLFLNFHNDIQLQEYLEYSYKLLKILKRIEREFIEEIQITEEFKKLEDKEQSKIKKSFAIQYVEVPAEEFNRLKSIKLK